MILPALSNFDALFHKTTSLYEMVSLLSFS
jgi:hypothetical protein